MQWTEKNNSNFRAQYLIPSIDVLKFYIVHSADV